MGNGQGEELLLDSEEVGEDALEVSALVQLVYLRLEIVEGIRSRFSLERVLHVLSQEGDDI